MASLAPFDHNRPTWLNNAPPSAALPGPAQTQCFSSTNPVTGAKERKRPTRQKAVIKPPPAPRTRARDRFPEDLELPAQNRRERRRRRARHDPHHQGQKRSHGLPDGSPQTGRPGQNGRSSMTLTEQPRAAEGGHPAEHGGDKAHEDSRLQIDAQGRVVGEHRRTFLEFDKRHADRRVNEYEHRNRGQAEAGPAPPAEEPATEHLSQPDVVTP